MKLSKTWTTVTPLSKTIALIMFIVLPFIGFYMGYQNGYLAKTLTQTTSVVTSNQESQPQQSCFTGNGCWYESDNGKVGSGLVKGYYTSFKTGNNMCDGFIVLEQNKTFNNIQSKDYDSQQNVLLVLALDRLSSKWQSQIKSSSKDNPVNLLISQIPLGGHDFSGCFPSTFTISTVSKVN